MSNDGSAVEATLTKTKSIDFQIIEIKLYDSLPQDFSLTETLTGQDFVELLEEETCSHTNSAVVCIFGRMETGDSIVLKVYDYKPYFDYISTESNSKRLLSVLSTKLYVDIDLLKSECFKRKKAWGWEPNEDDMSTVKEHLIHRVHFPTCHARKRAKYIVIPGFELVESKISAETQFFDNMDLIPSGWLTCSNFTESTRKISHCEQEIFAKLRDIQHCNNDLIAPIKICSFDIECSSDTGAFPNSKTDKVVMVSLVFWNLGEESTKVEQELVCLNSCDSIENANVYECKDEVDVLDITRDIIIKHNPDIMLGYNIFGFDWRFMAERAKYLKCQRFFYQSKLIAEVCDHGEMKLSSSAMGDNFMYIIHRTGGIPHDIFLTIKNEHKLSLYGLDPVSEHFLGEHKEDMPYNEVFAAWKEGGTSQTRQRVGVYCLKDSKLPIRLAHKLKTYISFVEMSRVTHTQIRDLILRGQQIKVYQQVVHFSHRMDYILNEPSDQKTGEFQGATVVEPKIGFYEEPIAVLDFMSLYPSIMIWCNLCYCTYVAEDKYKNLPGVTYDQYEFEGYTHTFTRNTEGILPKILRHLLAERKKTKKKMKAAKSKAEYDIYDKRQLAIKISCNSVYGFTGADTGMYKLKAIAETVTKVGRSLIDRTIHLSESLENTEVVYGDTDSVMLRFLDKPSRLEVFERGEKLADKITDVFAEGGEKIIVLEFEKVMEPYLLVERKRYCANSYETPDQPPKRDEKGLPTVRRDNTPIARTVLKDVLTGLMEGGGITKAEENLKYHLDKLSSNSYDFNMYIQSRSLRDLDGYSNPDALCQVQVVNKMNKRNPGSAPNPGDRVPFVITESKASKIAEKAEDPLYVKDNNIKVDRLYILDNQIENIISKIFGRIGGTSHAQLIKDCRIKLELQKNKQQTLGSFVSDGSQSILDKSTLPTLKKVNVEPKKKQQTLDLFVNTANTSNDNSTTRKSTNISFKVNNPSKKQKK